MQIDITSNSEIFIKQKLMEGNYQSPQELIDDAIRLLQEQDIIRKHRISEVNKKLKEGLESLQKGEFHSQQEIDGYFSEKFGF
jgi:putative addiction module CopG family antidote